MIVDNRARSNFNRFGNRDDGMFGNWRFTGEPLCSIFEFDIMLWYKITKFVYEYIVKATCIVYTSFYFVNNFHFLFVIFLLREIKTNII